MRKTFQLTIAGPIHAGDIFELYLSGSGETLFEFCGQTGPCESGKAYTRTFGGEPFGVPVSWKFEKTAGSSGPITVFKQGTDSMTSNSTITATYTYQ